ncbi:hypothetical protein [Crateriforma conspicua]|uniref:Uncharacterized protein n=1 Tax=Crateriforma conspicua TaxID=2527996 RepID=A0A5C5Y8L9_9PLAN|nr:hypothetical protein [Crateriforma conspicua]TWT72027.1 hypothetical protein Pan14r_43440 [Crateriforma conspicua]
MLRLGMNFPAILSMAELDRSSLLFLGGMVMLGWVLARRTIRSRRRSVRQQREMDHATAKIRGDHATAVPLCDAPVETQRWQVAMFDLQRELKGDLDTRIAIVQALLRQVDERIATLQSLSPTNQAPLATPTAGGSGSQSNGGQSNGGQHSVSIPPVSSQDTDASQGAPARASVAHLPETD